MPKPGRPKEEDRPNRVEVPMTSEMYEALCKLKEEEGLPITELIRIIVKVYLE